MPFKCNLQRYTSVKFHPNGKVTVVPADLAGSDDFTNSDDNYNNSNRNSNSRKSRPKPGAGMQVRFVGSRDNSRWGCTS